jgi:hypothetical protein
MECTMRQEVVVFGLSRHTQRWGTDFEVWLVGGARNGEQLFLSRDWETNTGYAPDPPLQRRGSNAPTVWQVLIWPTRAWRRCSRLFELYLRRTVDLAVLVCSTSHGND